MTAIHKDKTFFTAEDAEETPSCSSSVSSASFAVKKVFFRAENKFTLPDSLTVLVLREQTESGQLN